MTVSITVSTMSGECLDVIPVSTSAGFKTSWLVLARQLDLPIIQVLDDGWREYSSAEIRPLIEEFMAMERAIRDRLPGTAPFAGLHERLQLIIRLLTDFARRPDLIFSPG